MPAERVFEGGEWSRTGRRVGYVIAAVVNIVLIFVVVNLLGWGWLPFLTAAFDDLLPVLVVSLVVSAVVNLAWVAYDRPWFKALGQIIDNVTSLLVVVVTLKIFPFDFSPYRINWETITKVGLWLVAFAIAAATIAEFIKLVREVARSQQPS
jgi:hypothetical protein